MTKNCGIEMLEFVRFRAAFPRHGIIQASLILLIWLSEKDRNLCRDYQTTHFLFSKARQN